MNRKRSLKLDVLRILKDCGEYLLPEEALFNQMRARVRPPPTTAELKEALGDLDKKLYVLGIREDDEIKWKVTERGLVELLEAEMG